MIAVIKSNYNTNEVETTTNNVVFDYNLLLKNALNTKEDFESLNSCFLGNNTYLQKRTLQIVRVSKIIDMF